ncbi:36164_t:CDS:2 [Gigaspora margarita]|uniref:36164_t:CDS:1 n=1 Tax=Gigaspora margarita TaxID=4874 RepID=A0ABM8VX74_GIGMA|nr:36164_t:CDS:2 [Gigaspora margarita]
MSKKNSTNILDTHSILNQDSYVFKDSKGRVLKLESFSLETSLEIEKVPHEICVQNITKNEDSISILANDNNTMVNRNLNNIDDPMNWSSKKKWLVLAIITIAGPSMPIGGSIPVNYSSRYNFTTLEIGLFFIAPSLGYMLGSLIGGKYSDFLAQKFLSTSGNYCPEVRIKAAWFGSLLLPIAIFIYGWLLEINFNVYVLGIILFLCDTFNTLSTYLVDSCPGLGASVMALTCLIRLAIPATIAIFETTIEERLDVRWMFTLISVICFLGILLLVVVYINGRKWRSNFVSTI